MDRAPEQDIASENAQETTIDEQNVQARDGSDGSDGSDGRGGRDDSDGRDDGDDGQDRQPVETPPEAPSRSTDRLPTTDWLDGEPLTSAIITRYFKLTAVMLGLNVVLAGVSVIALFRQPSEPRTIVVAAPPIALAQPTVLASPPAVTQAATPPEAAKADKPATSAPRAFPATPTPTVEKAPLLGVPSTKRSGLASAVAPKRPPVATAKSATSASATSQGSEDEAPGVHLAERW
jgi:hypothetical protein